MIYLDYASTTPIDEEVLSGYQSTLQKYFVNSESLYSLGQEVFDVLEKSRQYTASLLPCLPNEIIFTSGASESNNLAIKGIAFKYQKYGKHLITSKIEHSSVIHTFEQLESEFGFEVTYLDVDYNGVVSLSQLQEVVREDTILCSIMYVNNEIGSIQPIEEIATIVKKYPKCSFHVDAVQAIGKIPLRLTNVDLVSISAHKIHGLKGSGILIKKRHVELLPLINGGQQEFGLRGGTSNVCVHIMFAKTLRLALEKMDTNYTYVKELNDYLRDKLSSISEVIINSPKESSPYILSLSCIKLPSEVHMNALSNKGIYVSAKSTCGSKQKVDSHVLTAMKLPNEIVQSVIRVSFSHLTTIEDIDVFVDAIKENIEKYGI